MPPVMSQRSGKGLDAREREQIEDYEYRYYDELRNGKVKIKLPNSLFRCPYCDREDRRDYSSDELLRHALDRSRSSGRAKEVGKHLALERYVKKYYASKSRGNGAPDESVAEETPSVSHGKWASSEATPAEKRSKLSQGEGGSSEATAAEKPSELSRGEGGSSEANNRMIVDQLFVWPPMGIVANIKTDFKDARSIGESGSKLRDEFQEKGFNPVKVEPLWNRQDHSGFAVVKFRRDWKGFCDALAFGTSFESKKCGKNDFYHSRERGDRLYGWVAQDDDYHSPNVIGQHLSKKGDLKSVTEKEAEDIRIQSELESSLRNAIEMKSSHIEKMKTEYERTKQNLDSVMAQKENMLRAYNEETQKMQTIARGHFEKLFSEHDKKRRELEAQQKELANQEKKLEQREFQNESETRKLKLEKDMNRRAFEEQKKADENLLRLAEAQQREKEELHKKIIYLQKEIDDKQALELEIQRMRGAVEVMEHMKDDEEPGAREKMKELKEQLKEKEDELETIDEITQALVVKHRLNTDELEGARKEVIAALSNISMGRAAVGVKRMGELDNKPFVAAAKRKCGKQEAGIEAAKLCSFWQDRLRDPSWHPFKIITHEGESVEIVDENDEELKPLREEYGDAVYEAVKTAMSEMNEYNPSGRYTVPVLWNFKEKRRATLAEGAERILKQWKTHNKKKT